MTTKASIFKTKTAFNSITIKAEEDFWTLRTAEQDLQSKINRLNPEQLALVNLRYLMGILIFLPPPRHICLLGTGGGGLIHFLRHYYPDSRITAVEIDGELLDIMHEKMALPSADEQLTYIVDDAGNFIDDNRRNYDLIIVDLFLGNQSPPWLLEMQTTKRLYSMLTDQGGISFNLLIDQDKEFTRYYDDLSKEFNQKTLYLPVPEFDNTIAFAFRQEKFDQKMTDTMQNALALGSLHNIEYMEILSAIYSTNPSGVGVI